MEPDDSSLSCEDCDAMVNHLDASLSILEKSLGNSRPGFEEIRIKSVLSVLRSEIAKAGRSSRPPFAD